MAPPISPWSVRFRERDVEKAFRKYAIDKGGRTDQLLMVSGGMIHLFYGILDWILLPTLAPQFILIRLCGFLAIMALASLTLTDWGKTRMMTLTIIIVSVVNVSMAYIFFAMETLTPPYYVGLIHLAVVFSAVARLNVRICAALLASTYASFAVGSSLIPWGTDVAFAHFTLMSILFSCAAGNYFLEHNRRLEYILYRDKERYYTQVRQMVDDAENSIRRKNALLNVLGHVVKTPLHQVIGYAQILEQSEDLPPEDREVATFASEIHRAGHALSHQCQRILDYSRADSGLISANPQRSNANRLVREASHRHQATADEKRISFVVDCCETPILVDTRHATRALDELIDNAVRYCPPGSEVRITTSESYGVIMIAITDNGPGIPEGDIERVGDALTKIDEFRNMGGDKLGIGVSLARTLLHITGGTLRFSSFPDIGSRAEVLLPIKQEESEIKLAS